MRAGPRGGGWGSGQVAGPAHANWLPAAVAARIARREDDLAEVLTKAAGRRTAIRLKVSAVPLIVAVVLAVVLAVTTHRNDSTSGASPGYQTVLHNHPVSLPDADHEIDLMTGHAVTGETGTGRSPPTRAATARAASSSRTPPTHTSRGGADHLRAMRRRDCTQAGRGRGPMAAGTYRQLVLPALAADRGHRGAARLQC